MIELASVSKIFPGAEVAYTALNQINLKIAESEFTAIIGKSGSGKSTLQF